MTFQSRNSSRLADFMDVYHYAKGISSHKPPLLLQSGTLQLLQRLFISCTRHEDGERLRIGSQADAERPTALSYFLAPFNDGSTETGGRRTLSISLGGEFVVLTLDTKAATAAEHAMSVRDALRLYPKAIAFSMILSLALVMEGYDAALLGAFPVLREVWQLPTHGSIAIRD
jgi:hypothetical protein